MDNLNTPDNMSKNTHTKLFKSQFSGASGNNISVRKQFGVFQKEQNRLSAHNLFSSKQKPLSKNKKPMKN